MLLLALVSLWARVRHRLYDWSLLHRFAVAMLEKVPGAFINIGNGGGEGGCEVHNPGYDFNDEIITLGATLWSRVVETRLAKDAR